MQLIYFPEVLLFFSIILEHSHAFFTFQHKFKTSVAVEISLFHSKIFTNNIFHFLVTAKSATSQVFQSRVFY